MVSDKSRKSRERCPVAKRGGNGRESQEETGSKLDRGNSVERCPVEEAHRNINLVPPKSQKRLSEKEQADYREYRDGFLGYLLNMGKNPDKAEGYSGHTVYVTSQRTARFDRWLWDKKGHYHVPPSEEEAQEYMREIALRDDITESTKGKNLEALKHYSKWLTNRRGHDPWEFRWSFRSGGGNSGPRDFLTKEERQEIRQAALRMDGNPAYGEDDEEVSSEDTSWKYTSLFWTALDAGLRPIEVGRARTSWVDTENSVLRIPREESSKNEGNWTVGIQERTSDALERWLEERADKSRYDGTDRLWLTRHGNPYGSKGLSRLLRSLCDDADIPYEGREMSFYAIRHSVGTYMTKERDLAATKAQLRHRDVKTTMKYDQVPVEDRKEALEKMG
jgi:integrase